MDRHVGVRQLRAELATHLRRAAAGHRVVITVGGRPAAVLGPIEPEREASIDTLIAAGLLVAPRRTEHVEPDDPVPVWSGTRLDQALREVRG